ncbi:MAG: acetyl-CoA carboxylase biotin carboxyl carrier protein [Campylobacterales bacterium]
MDSAKLNEIVDIFNSGELSKLKLEEEGFSLTLEKDLVVSSSPRVKIKEEVATTEQQEAPKKRGEMIVSPMVGTYYQAPSPTSQPFLQVGDVIKKGQPIAIIEAMKIMNEIEAEFDCKIVAIMVEDGQPIEFNTPLFEIERV